jgi:hypothetical protein
MKQIIARGRQLGKSTIIDIQNIILKQQAAAMQKSIDYMIMDEVWDMNKYQLHKSWKSRNGTKMHRIGADYDVRRWLEEEHSQYGISNPDWWKFENNINITDKLYTLMVLKFAE